MQKQQGSRVAEDHLSSHHPFRHFVTCASYTEIDSGPSAPPFPILDGRVTERDAELTRCVLFGSVDFEDVDALTSHSAAYHSMCNITVDAYRGTFAIVAFPSLSWPADQSHDSGPKATIASWKSHDSEGKPR